MTETVKKGKRKKLFQVAKELNLSTDTIREFLEKKGVSRITPNMRIDEEIYDQLLQRFSFEKKEADKIQRRRDERDRELAEQQGDADEAIDAAEEPEELEETVPQDAPEPEEVDDVEEILRESKYMNP